MAKTGYKNCLAFGLFWVVVFLLYLPAAKAGRVGDFPGWVKNVSTMKFWDYVNRTESHIPSLYQFTQMVTWFFYQFFGAKAWPWHMLYVTIQALNRFMLFVFCRNLFSDSQIKNGAIIASAGSMLFTICPHITEVVVWEPSFHYLQGLLFILLILLCAQRFMRTSNIRFAWVAGILFFLSTYSLEVFYLTPLFTFLLCLYYYMGLNYDKAKFRRAILYFSLPQVILFALHLVVLNAVYHSGIGHVGTATMQASSNNFSKPLKYIFHIVFFGRYLPEFTKHKIYALSESFSALVVFYGALVALIGIIVLRYKTMHAKTKAMSFLFLLVLFSTSLLVPVWFPDSFLVIYDRYTYVVDAFTYVMLTLLASCIPYTSVAIIVWSLYALGNIYVTHKVVKMWKISGDLVNKLVYTFPNDSTKTVLILNVPECYYGVQMIGSREEGEFKILYNAVMPEKMKNPVFEVSSYNLFSPSDGAYVTVYNDSILHVTLRRWGACWYWYGMGAISYENEYYKLNMRSMGHWYELILKQPALNYKLIYQIGDEWKAVNMSKKNVDQY